MAKTVYKEIEIDINTHLLIEDIVIMTKTMNNKDIENIINTTIDNYVI